MADRIRDGYRSDYLYLEFIYQPIEGRYGSELSSVAITFSITSFALAFSTLFAGKLQDKLGIHRLIAYGEIVLGAGLKLS